MSSENRDNFQNNFLKCLQCCPRGKCMCCHLYTDHAIHEKKKRKKKTTKKNPYRVMRYKCIVNLNSDKSDVFVTGITHVTIINY